jgi:hypothetical protein
MQGPVGTLTRTPSGGPTPVRSGLAGRGLVFGVRPQRGNPGGQPIATQRPGTGALQPRRARLAALWPQVSARPSRSFDRGGGQGLLFRGPDAPAPDPPSRPPVLPTATRRQSHFI